MRYLTYHGSGFCVLDPDKPYEFSHGQLWPEDTADDIEARIEYTWRQMQ